MSTKEVVSFTDLEPHIQNLIKESVAVREQSYSPYSKFKVGAAILCNDGFISTGCNVENVSYPVGICAETAAIAKAISEGKRKFKALAVVGNKDKDNFITPCGLCRQAMAEFGDISVYLSEPEMKSALRTTVSSLLPLAFNNF
ncbi:cytidine deaminase-like [Colletes gigas]|uniref:cytidine deaminase-like n=1 Tax=Colletes gigas TaxID=935657 RepID=UPI001C9B9E29|nr:cytidine deaminase-like [Colletes gigas]